MVKVFKNYGDGSRWKIVNQGKKIKDTRNTFNEYYTLKELDISFGLLDHPHEYIKQFLTLRDIDFEVALKYALLSWYIIFGQIRIPIL
jgi:hypothetical protein